MSIMRKIGVVAGAVVLSGTAIGVASAVADDEAVRDAGVAFRAKAQNELYDTNLAHPKDTGVTTETPELGVAAQSWRFNKVAETHEGTGVFTIEADTSTGLCITNDGSDRPVLLEKCNDGNMAQRWFVNSALEHSTIVSEKNKNEALAAEGAGQVVRLVEVFGKPNVNQLWTFIYSGQ
ncbi:hypothetical protein ACIQOW_27290 [Kitasatospora sp. NPDC091335]|uniref:hypothetical protein n=1 Tax=Kitasatospora sp. NPDC091335 TaxID=3364085 RepID=UPI00381C7C54